MPGVKRSSSGRIASLCAASFLRTPLELWTLRLTYPILVGRATLTRYPGVRKFREESHHEQPVLPYRLDGHLQKPVPWQAICR